MPTYRRTHRTHGKKNLEGGNRMKKVLVLFVIFLLAGMVGFGEETEKKADSKDKNIKVTFIELGSVRCIPCKKMMPIMKEIEKEYGDQVKVVFHDVWTPEGKPFAAKYKIKLIPTQVFLDNEGNEYFRHQGFFAKEELVKVLKQKGVK